MVWCAFIHTCREHYNPFVPYLKLLGGFFSSILTVLWILHIILYMLFDVRAQPPCPTAPSPPPLPHRPFPTAPSPPPLPHRSFPTAPSLSMCSPCGDCVPAFKVDVLPSRSSLWQPYISTFLNKFLIFFDGFFPLFGTLSVGVMSGASPRHPTPFLSSSLAWLLTTAPPPQCVHNVRVVCVCVRGLAFGEHRWAFSACTFSCAPPRGISSSEPGSC
jgi:hypothetical protein